MRILALDSSGPSCSVAVWSDGRIRAHRFEAMARGHAERLVPMILDALAEVGLGFAEIDVFAATVGPGAFTGLRIGLATLRGLALAAGKPMLGFTSFEIVAHGTLPAERRGHKLLVLLESKRADLYVQAFDERLAPACEPMASLPEAIAANFAGQAVLLAGDGAARCVQALKAARCDVRESASPVHLDATAIATLAGKGTTIASTAPPAPLYLRAPAVTFPGRGRQ